MAQPARFSREELDDVVERWLEANLAAERSGDWRPLADFFTDDASYGWNIGPTDDVMCVGIDEIREIAFGQEMEGLLGWRYPYQRVLVDERLGEVVGFWKQVATDTTGADHEIYGLGGSWFGYAGGGKWAWQRDFFDFGHVSELYLMLLKSGNVTKEFSERVAKNATGQRLPGWYPRGTAPAPIWPPNTGHGSAS
ncbi:nuclear transport factor 2 family protein [Mycolicibacillus parakoreensis]|uniref:Nuclear transport factor 2 family protein n=1 Tax=Mycolicibacillus parakoreensis TaxID=1069221 RepID=A0ABY3U8D9_9MYCO|nr:nuclear transport factor 2 family protein [Mycolicibacillus parakoreensis]MCV7314768.1 nuclear transport factor 2 family protein [Mycolicibacillus parakoreensis]ULN53772.1 nuclear transport factor 2 family protein [Mycolicibacillus parakoreensis]